MAVPLYHEIPSNLEPRNRYLIAFLTHESFHQYQRRAFSDVDTPSKEAHPVPDVENNARAALQMLVPEEAFSALESGDTAALRVRTAEAPAIHETRWGAGLDLARDRASHGGRGGNGQVRGNEVRSGPGRSMPVRTTGRRPA